MSGQYRQAGFELLIKQGSDQQSQVKPKVTRIKTISFFVEEESDLTKECIG